MFINQFIPQIFCPFILEFYSASIYSDLLLSTYYCVFHTGHCNKIHVQGLERWLQWWTAWQANISTWVWVPGTHRKKSGHGGAYLYSKSWRSRKGELRTHWPVSLVTLVNFMFSERPCLENQVREWLEETLDLDLCRHMNAHLCADTVACKHTWTSTTHMVKKVCVLVSDSQFITNI